MVFQPFHLNILDLLGVKTANSDPVPCQVVLEVEVEITLWAFQGIVGGTQVVGQLMVSFKYLATIVKMTLLK